VRYGSLPSPRGGHDWLKQQGCIRSCASCCWASVGAHEGVSGGETCRGAGPASPGNTPAPADLPGTPATLLLVPRTPRSSSRAALVGATWLSQVRGRRWDLSKHTAQPTPSQSPWGMFTLSYFGGYLPITEQRALLPPALGIRHHCSNQFAEAAAFPKPGGDGRQGSPSSSGGGHFWQCQALEGLLTAGPWACKARGSGGGPCAGSSPDQSTVSSLGPGGGRRCEMKWSKVLRVRTRELERIRRQLGKGGGEGREQQRSAERNVLMGRQPERRPGPPLPKAV